MLVFICPYGKWVPLRFAAATFAFILFRNLRGFIIGERIEFIGLIMLGTNLMNFFTSFIIKGALLLGNCCADGMLLGNLK
jgi:hypothetical protein